MSVLLPANGSITIDGDISGTLLLNFLARSSPGPVIEPTTYPNFPYFTASASVSSGLGPNGSVFDAEYFCSYFCGLTRFLPSGYIDISDQFRTLTVSTSIFTEGLGPGSQYQLFLDLPPGLTVAVPEPATWLLLLIGFIVLCTAKRRLRRFAVHSRTTL